MRQVRITGLVGLAQRVRRQWAMSSDAAARDAILRHIRQELTTVDAILLQHRAQPEHLPSPSRRAYLLLQQLASSKVDAAQIVEASAAPQPMASAAPPESVSFKGLRAFHDRVLDNIAAAIAEDRGDSNRTLEVIQNTCKRLERYVATGSVTTDQLTPASRDLLAWFRWFSLPENFAAYCEAVERAQRILGSVVGSRLRWTNPLLVRFQPTSKVYQWQIARGGTRISLTMELAALDDGGLRMLGRWMLRDRDAGQAVMELLEGEECRELSAALRATVGDAQPVQGMTHDLAASFERVNQQYFGGQMHQPRLVWSPSLTGRRFGHYQVLNDTVCVSSSLDRPDVPAYVVDHIMHHELLHKKHGTQWKGERRRVHTPEFRADERSFPQYAQADAFLRKLARE